VYIITICFLELINESIHSKSQKPVDEQACMWPLMIALDSIQLTASMCRDRLENVGSTPIE